MIMADTRMVLDDNVTEVTDRYHRKTEYPPAGEHLWTLLGVFRVRLSDVDRGRLSDVDRGRVCLLGSSNLLTINGPSCFVCGQLWSAEVADAPCPGEASEAGD